MTWNWILFIPFIAQGFVLVFDEFYFHIQRGLPLWERIGHPLDTLSVVLCLLFVLIFPFSRVLILPFIILSAISCLFVTKDEFVHKEHCDAKEQWLHALLFVLHPLVLISMGFMWAELEFFRPFLTIQLVFISLFFIYQIVYWNLVWKEK